MARLPILTHQDKDSPLPSPLRLDELSPMALHVVVKNYDLSLYPERPLPALPEPHPDYAEYIVVTDTVGLFGYLQGDDGGEIIPSDQIERVFHRLRKRYDLPRWMLSWHYDSVNEPLIELLNAEPPSWEVDCVTCEKDYQLVDSKAEAMALARNHECD